MGLTKPERKPYSVAMFSFSDDITQLETLKISKMVKVLLMSVLDWWYCNHSKNYSNRR